MGWMWTVFVTGALICALIFGQTDMLAAAVLDGARRGAALALSLAGPLCLWSGLNHAMAQIGLTARLSHLLRPVLSGLFPHAWQDPYAREALSANLAANLLGLGSAATPSGIRAAKRIAGDEHELCRLVVLNTASVQLIPATVAAVRAQAGAAAPFDILPAVWFTSLCAVATGLLAAKGLSKWF